MTTFDSDKPKHYSRSAMALDLTAYDTFHLFIAFNKVLRSINHSLLSVDDYSALLKPVNETTALKIILMGTICYLMTE